MDSFKFVIFNRSERIFKPTNSLYIDITTFLQYFVINDLLKIKLTCEYSNSDKPRAICLNKADIVNKNEEFFKKSPFLNNCIKAFGLNVVAVSNETETEYYIENNKEEPKVFLSINDLANLFKCRHDSKEFEKYCESLNSQLGYVNILYDKFDTTNDTVFYKFDKTYENLPLLNNLKGIHYDSHSFVTDIIDEYNKQLIKTFGLIGNTCSENIVYTNDLNELKHVINQNQKIITILLEQYRFAKFDDEDSLFKCKDIEDVYSEYTEVNDNRQTFEEIVDTVNLDNLTACLHNKEPPKPVTIEYILDKLEQ